MAKTNRRPSDKLERNQRLAQRPQQHEDDDFNERDWLLNFDVEDNEDTTQSLPVFAAGLQQV